MLSENMNKMYGFEGEVKAKYSANMCDLFTEVYNWLPLCHCINKRVRVCLSFLITRGIHICFGTFGTLLVGGKLKIWFLKCLTLKFILFFPNSANKTSKNIRALRKYFLKVDYFQIADGNNFSRKYTIHPAIGHKGLEIDH